MEYPTWYRVWSSWLWPWLSVYTAVIVTIGEGAGLPGVGVGLPPRTGAVRMFLSKKGRWRLFLSEKYGIT